MLQSKEDAGKAHTQSGEDIAGENLVPIHAIRNSRRIAVVSLVSPILFMTSLVTAAIVVMSARGGVASALSFWAMAQCFVCSSLFLVSLREKSILFDRDLYTVNSPMWRFTAVGLGVAWGLVPAVLVALSPATGALVSGAVMSGCILSSTLLLRALPRVATALLIAVCAGFFGYTIVRTDTWSTIISLVMLVYFSALVICTRWYFARFDKRLEDAETVFAETAQLQSVLEEVGESSSTAIWRTDDDLKLTEISQLQQFGAGDGEELIGKTCLDLFLPSPERDLLSARLIRRSEIVALEL
ncbi:MAG: PAS domain-containing protein, partial [Pseudomonadota bacterium]